MSVSQIPSTIDAVCTLFKTAMPGIAVYDGMGVSTDEPNLYVMVGISDADALSKGNAADSTITWVGMSSQHTDEQLKIHCIIVSTDGDGNQQASRNSAENALDAFGALIRADPTLGGVVMYVQGITDTSFFEIQDNRGAHTELSFTLAARARPQDS